jgi:hypothetical protein
VALGVQFSKVGPNPTNGSWWMVQVRPTSGAALPLIPPTLAMQAIIEPKSSGAQKIRGYAALR